MALHVQASFSAGELDPALRERTTLDKYTSGLSTARNVLIAKTGRIVTRSARQFLFSQYNNGTSFTKFIVYSPPYSGVVLEWGHLYVRVISISPNNIYGTPDAAVLGIYSHPWLQSDLPNINFESTQGYVYAFCKGKAPLKLYPGPGGGFLSSIFAIPAAPIGATVTTTTASGNYGVDYFFTVVAGGQESTALGPLTGSRMVLAAGENNVIDVDTGVVRIPAATTVNIYRRPAGSGLPGFISSSPVSTSSGSPAHIHFTFKDIGIDADYTHTPPTISAQISDRDVSITDPSGFLSGTGLIYQQRLLLTDTNNPEAIVASRTGYQNNFYRDYPLSDSSSLVFKAGSSGFAQVIKMIESDGLIVFTTAGVFIQEGALTPDNLSLTKKGNWVLDSTLNPLAIPGGVLFLDSLTNTVRVLAYSTELATYTGAELSIFSEHLFLGRKIVSWAYQDGDTPVLWAVFNDGQYASFTYEPTQNMRAWTRCDSESTVECVTGTGEQGTTVFVCQLNGLRWMERTLPRYVSIADTLADTEAAMGPVNAFMDMVSTQSFLLTGTVGAAHYYDYESNIYDGTLTLVPVDGTTWDGPLTLTTSGGSAQALFTSGVTDPYAFNVGAVGTIYRFFDPTDQTSVDLVVTARASNFSVTVQPSTAFDPTYATNPKLYVAVNQVLLTGEYAGLDVSVMVDGYVVGSPNNDFEQLPLITAVAGAGGISVVTLPTTVHGAIIHVGLPITADVETLDMETVEQRPILIESKTVNKVYVKLYKSRGVYAGPEFAPDNTIGDMEELDTKDVNYEIDPDGVVLGNAYSKPQTLRCEVMTKGSWDSNGRFCLRQVDPIHFEILSIIPDVTDLRRSG